MKAVAWELTEGIRQPWLRTRFGDHYAQVSTDTKLKLRSSVKDVARVVHGHVPEDIEAMCSKFQEAPQGITDYDFVHGYDTPEGHVTGSIHSDLALQTYVAKYPEEWATAKKCLGQSRSRSRHACAFAVCNKPVHEFIPTTIIGEVKCTQYTAASVEAAGALKMDFLVVNSLRDIEACIKFIQERSGRPIPFRTTLSGRQVPWQRLIPVANGFVDVWNLPEDQAVFREICEGKTETVFQLSTPGAIKWLREFNYWKDRAQGLKAIDSLEALSAFTALDRPGPLDAYIQTPDGKQHNMLVEYARRARGEVPHGAIASFDGMFPETHGVLCVAEGQMVRVRSGPKPIQEVLVGDEVQTETGEWKPVIGVWDKGEEECVVVRMANGVALQVTADHEVMTARGWVKAGELSDRDLVRQFWFSDEPLPEGTDADWLVGLLLADGDLCTSTPTVCCSSEEFAQKVKQIADRAWGLNCTIYFHTRAWYVCCSSSKKQGAVVKDQNPLTKWLRSHDMTDRSFDTKCFPPSHLISLAMLTGFWEGDGCMKNRRLRVKNYDLAFSFWEGLQRARIHSSLFEDEPGVWTVSVQGALPMRIKENRSCAGVDYVPVPDGLSLVKEERQRRLMYQRSRRPFLHRHLAQELAQACGNEAVSDAIWGLVKSVKPCGARRVYDLSVADVHSFVVGGSVVHNCYQEQLERMYRELTGCSGSEAEEFRSNVAKKKMDKVQRAYPFWMENAGAKVGQAEAQRMWNNTITFGQYGFNKAHSVCYMFTAYACAWLKHHFPLEWWCAVLGNAKKAEVASNFWAHCGHLVDMPDINNPAPTFSIVGERIRAPVDLVLGIGEKAQDLLRKLGPFASVQDLAQKVYEWRVANRKPKLAKGTQEQERDKKGNLKWTLATSPLNRGVIHKLLATGCMDTLFPAGELLEDKMMAYEAALAATQGDKPEPIPQEYVGMSTVDRYRVIKSVLPVYHTPLMPLLQTADSESWPLVGLKQRGKNYYQQLPKWGEVPVVSWAMVEALNEKAPWPEDLEVVVCVPVYVTAQERFTYPKNVNDKTACRLSLELDGTTREFVRWPERRTQQLPDAYYEDLKQALGLAVFKRYTESRPFALEDVVVFHWPKPKEKTSVKAKSSKAKK